MFVKLIERMKQSKEQEREAQLQKAEKLLSNENNCNNGNDDSKSKDEPPVKKVKSEDGAKAKTAEKKSDEAVKGEKGDTKPKQLPFNEEKYLRRMDKWCENCRKDIPDPRLSEMVMFLHAVKFKVDIRLMVNRQLSRLSDEKLFFLSQNIQI